MINRNQFLGAGPRLGATVEYRLGENMGVFGTLAGSALIGRSEVAGKVDVSYYGAGYGYQFFKDEETRVVWQGELEAGVSFHMGDHFPGTIQLGNRIDSMFGVLDTDTRTGAYASGSDRDDFIHHGPFVRLSIPLN